MTAGGILNRSKTEFIHPTPLTALGLALLWNLLLGPLLSPGEWEPPPVHSNELICWLYGGILVSSLAETTRRMIAGTHMSRYLALIFVLLSLPLGKDLEAPMALLVLLPASILVFCWSSHRTSGGTYRNAQMAELTAVTSLSFAFIMLKLQTMAPTATDENIYFYQAYVTSQGVLPYRDFFFAHPPLHLGIPALLFSIFGFSIGLAKAIAPLLALGTGLCLWWMLRERERQFMAVSALFLFLFAAATLKASSNLTGVNTTLFFFTVGMFALKASRMWLAGALLAMSLSAGFYMAAAVMAVLAWEGVATGKLRSRLNKSFLAVFGVIQGGCFLIGGENFLTSVYLYHFKKPLADTGKEVFWGTDSVNVLAPLTNFIGRFLPSKDVMSQLYYDGGIWILTSCLLVFALFLLLHHFRSSEWQFKETFLPKSYAKDASGSPSLLPLFALLAMLFQFSLFQEIHSHYFALLTPFLAICSAMFLWGTLRELQRPGSAGKRLAVVTILFVSLAVISPLRMSAAYSAWPAEKEHALEQVPYTWKDSSAVPAVDPIVQGLFWKSYRIRGLNHSPTSHYLWSKKRWFSEAEAIAAKIRIESKPEETISGASTVAPLIALLSNRHLANHEADTNSKRFKSGLLTERDFVNQMCSTPVAWIIGTSKSFFPHRRMMQSSYWREHFKFDTRVQDEGLRNNGWQPIDLYKRKNTNVPCTWVDQR